MILAKEFIYTLENSNVVIVMGETGSGKTTSKAIIIFFQMNKSHDFKFKLRFLK